MRLFWALAAPMCDPTYGRRSSHQSLALSVEIIGHSRIPYEASSFNGQLARQRLIVFSAARVWELECPIATAGSVRRVSVRRLARPRCPAHPRTVLRRLVASRARARRLSARPAIREGELPTWKLEGSPEGQGLARRPHLPHLPCACGCRIGSAATRKPRAHSAHAHRESAVFSRVSAVVPFFRLRFTAFSLTNNYRIYNRIGIFSLNKYLIKRATRHTI
jgi:hypothetical protein